MRLISFRNSLVNIFLQNGIQFNWRNFNVGWNINKESIFVPIVESINMNREVVFSIAIITKCCCFVVDIGILLLALASAMQKISLRFILVTNSGFFVQHSNHILFMMNVLLVCQYQSIDVAIKICKQIIGLYLILNDVLQTKLVF